jgi:hypothetical protein
MIAQQPFFLGIGIGLGGIFFGGIFFMVAP